MLKQTITFFGLSFIFTTIYAGGMEIPPPMRLGDFNGVYIGANGGVLIGTASNRLDSTISATGTPITLQQDETGYNAVSNMVFGLQLGWGHEFDWFYLGFDINGTYQNFRATNRYETDARTTAVGSVNTNILTTSKLETSYGIDFRPGVLLSPAVLLFGKIGVVRSLFKVQATTQARAESGGATNNVITNNLASENTYGMRVGIGVETKASRYIGLGLEYQYTTYPNLSGILTHNPGNLFSSVNTQFNNSFSTGGVLFDINYYLNNPVNYEEEFAHYSRGGFDGLYLGLHGGVRKGSLRYNLRHASVTSAAAGSVNAQAQDAESDATGGFAGLHLGYGHVFRWFYLGAEAQGTFQQIHVEGGNLGLTATGVNPAFSVFTQTSAVLDGNYGVDIKSGVVVSPAVLLYARVGVDETRVRFQSNSALQATGLGTSTLFLQEPSELTGLRLGAGVQTKIAKSVGLNIEYLYTTYGNVTTKGSTATPFAFATSTSYTMRTQAFLAGLDYFFNE